LVVARVDSAFSDSIEPGKVIGTSPEAETGVKKGDSVKLILSKGIIKKMPNIVGVQLSQAQLIIEKMDLIMGKIEEVQGSGRKGTIIIQNPEPGRIVNSGDTVTVMVIK
jgi:beta-lactam-binding protein with PASTA domain